MSQLTKTLISCRFIKYFLRNYKLIIQDASEYGAVKFKGFDVRSPEEFASILYKSGLKEVQYIGGAAVRKLSVGRDAQKL